MDKRSADNVELIRKVETLALGAWPAEESVALDGWQLRFTHGVTRRANSVWPNEDHGAQPLAEKVAAVESFYRLRKLPPRFQICPAAQPLELDAILAARGYAAIARTHVQRCALAELLAGAEYGPRPLDWTLRVAPRFNAEWFAAYQHAEAFDAHAAAMRAAILNRIAAPAGFALLTVAGRPVSLGLGVAEGGYLGIFSMATVPEYRRQGAATAVLHALGQWAAELGARHAYLQVMQENKPAQALYARAGFITLYDYAYRELAA